MASGTVGSGGQGPDWSINVGDSALNAKTYKAAPDYGEKKKSTKFTKPQSKEQREQTYLQKGIKADTFISQKTIPDKFLTLDVFTKTIVNVQKYINEYRPTTTERRTITTKCQEYMSRLLQLHPEIVEEPLLTERVKFIHSMMDAIQGVDFITEKTEIIPDKFVTLDVFKEMFENVQHYLSRFKPTGNELQTISTKCQEYVSRLRKLHPEITDNNLQERVNGLNSAIDAILATPPQRKMKLPIAGEVVTANLLNPHFVPKPTHLTKTELQTKIKARAFISQKTIPDKSLTLDVFVKTISNIQHYINKFKPTGDELQTITTKCQEYMSRLRKLHPEITDTDLRASVEGLNSAIDAISATPPQGE